MKFFDSVVWLKSNENVYNMMSPRNVDDCNVSIK